MNDYVWDEINDRYIPKDDSVSYHGWNPSGEKFYSFTETTDMDDIDEQYLYKYDGELYYTDGDDDAEKKIHSMMGQVYSETDDEWIKESDALSVMVTVGEGWFEDYIVPEYHTGEIVENGGVKYLLDCDNAEDLFKKMTLPACIVA